MFSTLLAQAWGISSRDELLDTVSMLLANPVDEEYSALRPYMQQIANLPEFLRERLEYCLGLVGYMLGMIDLDEYLNISAHALAVTREYSQSWRDHADQYVLGRAKWKGVLDEEALENRDKMWVRLQHPNSMWVKYPLHGNYGNYGNYGA